MNTRFLLAISAAASLGASSVLADTITTAVDVRTVASSGNQSTDASLSLYSVGSNVQYTWLNFDLSAYSGQAITSDVTLTLKAQTFTGQYTSLTGVTLGTADAAWTFTGITHANKPSSTTVLGVTNPSGTFTTGQSVTWTIPSYEVEKWATEGYLGLALKSSSGSTLHFDSSRNGGAPTLTLTGTTATDGTWSAGDGNWTDSANWAATTVAQGIGKSATINGGTPVNITMNANRSIGSLAFSGTNHTISGSAKLALNVVSGSPTVSVEAARTATIGATLVGTDGLTKIADGNLTLIGINTYTGTTTNSAGTLQIGNGGSTGSLGSGAIVNNATLVYSFNADSTLSLPFGANISGSGNLAATAGVIQVNGNITQGGALTFTPTGASGYYKGLEVVGASTTLAGSSITLTGDVGKRNAPGNTFALDTSASNGTISLNISLGRNNVWYNLSSFSANAGTGAINITGGGGAGWAGTPVMLTGAVNMTGNVDSGAAVTIDSLTTTTGNISAAFSGGMSLTKSGTGTLSLTGDNTYTGTTTNSAGTLQIGNGGATGSLYQATVTTGGYNGKNLTFGSTGAIVNNSALVYNIAGGAVNVNKTISGTGTLSVTGNQSVNFANGTSITTAGSQMYSATATSGRSYGFNLTDNATVTLASTAGDISMTGYLGTANDHTGNLVIDTSAGNGSVTLNTPSGIYNVDYGLNSLAVNAGTGTISLGTYNGETWRLVRTISLTGGAINSTANLSDFNILTVTNSGTSTFSGNLTASGGVVVKAGNGTLTLSGVNTYSGTIVTNGALFVNGSLAGSVSVASGATLGGTNTIGPVTLASGALLSPGAATNLIGTLTLSGTAPELSGRNLVVDVSTTSGVCDKLVLPGTIDLTGLTVTVKIPGALPVANTYVLLSSTALSGTPTLAGDLSYPWQLTVKNNTLILSKFFGTMFSFF